jgi:hypothetical protein
MPEHDATRQGVGRRTMDEECKEHSNRLQNIETDVHKNTGRFTSMLWFMGVAGGFIGACMVFLVGKTTSIETLLTNNQVSLMQHSEQIKSVQSDVKDIQDRHRYLDQNGVVTFKPTKR